MSSLSLMRDKIYHVMMLFSHLSWLTFAHRFDCVCFQFFFWIRYILALCRFASAFFLSKNFNFQFRSKVHPKWYHLSCTLDHFMCLMHAPHSHLPSMRISHQTSIALSIDCMSFAIANIYILMAWQIFLYKLSYICAFNKMAECFPIFHSLFTFATKLHFSTWIFSSHIHINVKRERKKERWARRREKKI